MIFSTEPKSARPFFLEPKQEARQDSKLISPDKTHTKSKVPGSSYLEGSYNKIPNAVRDRLVEMVVVEHSTIKEAAGVLKLKYSTAKTIFKIFKKENRTFKFISRSRNPGLENDDVVRKIKKAPIPKFMLKF